MNETVHSELGAVAQARRGITYVEAALKESRDEGRPYINMKSFLKDGGYNPEGLKFYSGGCTKADFVGDRDLLIANTDVTREGDIIGVPLMIPGDLHDDEILFSHHVTRLALSEGIDPEFLYYLLCTDELRRAMKKYARGTTVLMLDMPGIKRIPVTYPRSVDQQQTLAAVLRAGDQAIAKTEALIEKYQQIKSGLMHDLFTRGIGADGKLRPPREQVPELYQETPIGWIPKDWGIPNLADLCGQEITYGIVQAGPHIEDGVPYIRTGDMSGEALDEKSLLRTSRKIAESYRRSEMREGEIVCAIRATVGKVLPVPPELDGANLTQGTARISPKPEVSVQFVLWGFRSHAVQKSISLSIKGTTFNEITLGDLRRLPFSIPKNLEEQEAIASKLNACEARIRSEKRLLEKLKFEKSGLMSDLLSGSVEVPNV